MSVRKCVGLSAWNNSAPTGRIFLKFGIGVFVEHLSRKFKSDQNRARKTGDLHEDHYTFSVISRSFLLTMKPFSDKICREPRNTHFTFNKFVFPHENRAGCEIMWKKFVERGRPQLII
jgi:hypothetical protein